MKLSNELLETTLASLRELKSQYLTSTDYDPIVIGLKKIHDQFADIEQFYYEKMEIAEEESTSEKDVCEKVIDHITEFREIIDTIVLKLISKDFYELEYYTKIAILHKLPKELYEEAVKTAASVRDSAIVSKKHKVEEIFTKSIFSLGMFCGLFKVKESKIKGLDNIVGNKSSILNI
jgi:hypothetical protein